MQVYVPLNTPGVTHEQASNFEAVAQVLERARPADVV